MSVALPNRASLSPAVLLTLIISCGSMLFFNNGIYLFACLFTIYMIVIMMWKKSRPGGIVFAFIMQWVQVIAFVLWMNIYGRNVDYLSQHGGTAIIFACMGLMVIAFVFSRRIERFTIPSKEEMARQASQINEKKIFMLYLFSTLFLASIGLALGSVSGGLTQVLVTLGTVKWLFFLMYGYVSWINKKNRGLLILMIIFEFSTGLFSYFSTFKEGIFYAIMLSLTFIRRITFKEALWGLVMAFVLAFIFLTWTAIKNDYRNYVNGGQNQQVVTVSRGDALGKMGDQIASLNWDRYQLALNALLYRMQYVHHLSLVMDRVPEITPHEYGGIWWENISFVLMPRLLFPNKPVYEATVKTKKYTGIDYAGYKQGAAFSLGYFADGYIDFGYLGMFVPLIFIALYLGFIYKVFYTMDKLNIFMRYGLVNIAMHEFLTFEADGLYLFGRLTLVLLFFWAASKALLPRIQRWLYK